MCDYSKVPLSWTVLPDIDDPCALILFARVRSISEFNNNAGMDVKASYCKVVFKLSPYQTRRAISLLSEAGYIDVAMGNFNVKHLTLTEKAQNTIEALRSKNFTMQNFDCEKTSPLKNFTVKKLQDNKECIYSKECKEELRNVIGAAPAAATSPAPFSTKARPTSVDEVAAYMASIVNDPQQQAKYPHYKTIDPEKAADVFWDFYESKGWLVGKQPMKLWTAAASKCVREWEKVRNTKGISARTGFAFEMARQQFEREYGNATESAEPEMKRLSYQDESLNTRN